MSALIQRITFPSNMHREAQLLYRMTQPLKGLLLCVKNTLQLMDELPAETERFLLTVPAVDQLHLDPTPECSICCQGFHPTEDSHSDTSGVRSDDLLVRLPCKHIICHGCLKDWLAKAGSCPICRHKLTSRIFIEDDTDPRTEVNSRPILESILNTGLVWLASITTEDGTEENTFGHYCVWANDEQTEEQCAAMDALKYFTVFSTSVEDAIFQGEFRQRWIDEFHRREKILRDMEQKEKDDRERLLREMEEKENDEREERYETNSEDERRYRENCAAEEEEQRKENEYQASLTRARSSRLSEFEEDLDHHYNYRGWGTDDEDEDLMAAEGEITEPGATDDSRGFAETDLRSDGEALGYSLLDLSSSPLANYNEQDQNDSF